MCCVNKSFNACHESGDEDDDDDDDDYENVKYLN